MKRVCWLLVLVIVLVCTLTGCSVYDVLQYKVPSTGERISVRIDKDDGFALTANEDGTFTIKQDDANVATGVLLPPEKMQKMRDNSQAMAACQILEEGSHDELTFLLLKITNNNADEWVYLVSVNGLQAGLALSSSVSEETIRACFEALSLRETES